MKLLVTGGAGFIGSNFILYWMKKHPQDSVVNFDALTYAGNLENLSSIEKNPRYTFVRGDIRDKKAVLDALSGIDIVVHFAAESHVDRSIMNPSDFVSTNVLGTQVLLEACVERKIARFHHISTDEVFGSLPISSSDSFDENTPYDPRSPYAASKAGSDHLVRAYHATFGLPITISNCSNNFGPYQFPEKFIPLAITNILEGKKVPVYGDGKNIRDWLYVTDHCTAIDIILQKGINGETYCIGGHDAGMDNSTVVKKILARMGKDESFIEFVPDRPGHDRKYAMNWGKIRDAFGWKPEHDFDTYLNSTIDWYQANAGWWKKIRSGTYREYYEKQYGART